MWASEYEWFKLRMSFVCLYMNIMHLEINSKSSYVREYNIIIQLILLIHNTSVKQH